MRGPRLGASYRRALLDVDLLRLAASFSGLVLDVGGKRVPRGGFTRPERGVRRWVLLNLAEDEAPDVVGSAETLPFKSDSLGGILCSEVIQYVDRYEAMLAEFRRVLVPGGRILLSAPLLHRLDHPTDRHRFSAGRLRELFAAAAASLADPLLADLINAETMFDLLAGRGVASASLKLPAGLGPLPKHAFGSLWGVFANSEYGIGNFYISLPAQAAAANQFRLRLQVLQWNWKLTAIGLPEHLRIELAKELQRRIG